MPLSKEDRIAFSKKIVSADSEIAAIEGSKAQIQGERQKAFDLDQANKGLVDGRNFFIDPYHIELSRYTGILRTSLTEAAIQDAAAKKVGNFLYPNDPQNPPPSLAPNLWIAPKPYARNLAVGRQYDENFPAANTAEQQLTSSILAAIATIESFSLIERTTGQTCTTPTPPPVLPDSIVPNTALLDVYNALVSDLNSLKSYAQATSSLIFVQDPDPARQAQANAAVADIPNVVAGIDAWLAVDEFDTGHGQTTCAGFNSFNASTLGPTRLQPAALDALELALTSRQSFVSTRVSQINGYLGNITQDLNTGDFTGSGFYFQRWNFVSLRLNFFGGSLIALTGFDQAINAQGAFQGQTELAKDTYSSILTTSLLAAPSNGTPSLSLREIGDLVVSDKVFLISDTQEELILTIASVSGKRITVNRPIPAKYRPEEFARVYKDKS